MGTLADALATIGPSIKASLQGLVVSNEKLGQIISRPAIISKQVELGIEKQRQQGVLDRALHAETVRQKGAGIGERVGGLFGETGGKIGGAVGGAAATGFDKLAGAASAVTGAFGVITGGVTSVASAVGSFVEKANPGAMERLNLVLDDVTGVIGQALTPVIETLTPLIRLFGDFLASILPSADEFREILKPVTEFLDDLREALASIAPIIKDVLMVALKAMGVVLKALIWPIQQLAKLITAIFGKNEEGLKSSVGAAARNVSFQSAESFSKSVNIAAFKSGQGGTGEYHGPLDKIGKTLDTISGTASDIYFALPWTRSRTDKEESIRASGVKGDAFSELNPLRIALSKEFDRIAIRGGQGGMSKDDRTYLNTILEGVRGHGKKAGISEENIEAEISRRQENANFDAGMNALERLIDQAKRRAMDGHAAGH